MIELRSFILAEMELVDWQTPAAVMIVLFAIFFLLSKFWGGDKSRIGCGSCSGCSSPDKEANKLIQLKKPD